MNIINDDCLTVFPKLESKNIDLVVVDLPYGQTSCKWDCLIDLDKMWEGLKHCCKKNCVYIFFCTTKFGISLINSNPKWFRIDLVWEKSKKVGFLSANRMPLRKHEMIYVFGNPTGGKKTYNPQKTLKDKPRVEDRKTKGHFTVYGNVKQINKTHTHNHPSSILQYEESKNVKVRGGKYNDSPYGDFKNTKSIPSDTKHPSTILKFNNPSKPVHRTQKPVDLCEWLIKSYSNEGDTVLDFTMGSGSTGVACKNTNRKFIGIEKDKDIFEIASKRLI
jgi:DNA modification methylase